jgi:hypothetical protein
MVGEQTKDGTSSSRKKYAIPWGVDMSNKSDGSVTSDRSSNKKSS